MRWIRFFLLIVSLVVIQTAIFPSLRVFGAVPDLLLVATVAVAYERGPEAGAVFGFVAGAAIDVFLASPMGVSALAFALTGYGIGIFQSGLVRSSRWMAPILGGIGGLVGGFLWICIASIAGQDDLFATASFRILVTAAIYDALVAFLVFPFARWACGEPDFAHR
ncbi:MAG: rod shape-determining protein MreD [Actinobacteria bacterium]|nr:rod shape-determining protein MreD [Actinomycetota bacterium]